MTRVASNPYPQGGLATPPPELETDEPAVEDVDQGDAGDDPADDAPADEAPRADRAATRSARGGRLTDDGAGWVLGLILWAGVALPFIKGGPAGVKAWWMAKFLNKAPDGSELP